MAQTEKRIINSWSLIAFAGKFGKVINKKYRTPENGTPFPTLSFRPSKDSTAATFVHFSSKLGDLDASQLKAMKDDLQIVQYDVEDDVLASRAEKGFQLESYILCRKGQIDYGEEIDLF